MVPEEPLKHPEYFPEKRQDIRLRGPAGLLECITDVADGASAQPVTAVLCHPHPQHGGTMHNKVVTILDRSLRELGLRTVRCNYRGVGESEGQYDDGYGETDDVLALVDWVRRVRPEDKLWLGGFSFGAYVSLRAAQNLELGQLISIAPPVQRFEFTRLDHPGCPWLVVQGDEDDVVSPDAVYEWAAGLEPAVELLVMEQTGHFFHRRLMDLRGLVKNGVRAQLPLQAAVSKTA